MDPTLKRNLTSSHHWLRFFFMLLMALFAYIASCVIYVVILIQFLFALITGEDNPKLRAFGASLSVYLRDAFAFLTYNSDNKPFPFSDWPSVQSEAPVSAHQESTVDEESDIIDATYEVDLVDVSPDKPRDSRGDRY